MAQRNIDFGAFPDDPDADAIRSAFEKVQLNFTEVFAGLGDQAVVSVNKTAGAGISVNQPTGNVVITNKLACVQFTSTTLSLTRDAPGNGTAGGSATITDSTQTLYIDMPNTVANISDVIVSNSIQGNAIIGNVSGDFGYILANATSGNGNITANNITLTAALSAANVSGNGAGLSAIAGANVTGTVPSATTAGTVTTIAQPNITSLGTLTTLDVQSTVTAVAFTANTGLFTGDGGGLSNIVSANLVGAVAFATTANAVAGANVSGAVSFATTANAVAGSNVSGAVSFATTANVVAGGNVSGEVNFSAVANAVAGANVSGTVALATLAADATSANAVAGANVSGEVTNAATANAVAGGNVSGAVSFAGTANAVAGANVSGEVTFAATANAVAGANVSGQVNFADTANAVAGGNVSGQVAFAGVANSVSGSNVSGAVADATTSVTAGTITTAAQPNITSTGTLTSVAVTGNTDSGNLNTTGVVSATGNITGGNVLGAGGVFTYVSGDGANLTNISVSTGSYIENGTSNARVDASGPFRVSVGGTANVLQVNNSGTAVAVTGALSVSGGIDNNINFNSTSNLGPESNVTITGGVTGAFLKTDGSGTLTWDTGTVQPTQGTDTQIIFNDSGAYAGNTGFTYNKTTGNLNAPGSIIAAGGVSAGILGGSLTTTAQPNISSVGTLTSLILSGILNTNSDIITNAGNISISGGTGTFKGDGGGLSNLPGSNVSIVPTATLATFATTANAVAGANVSGTVASATLAADATSANAVAGGNVSGAVSFSAVANSVSGANVSGAVASATLAADATSANAVAGANVSGAVSFATTANLVAGGNVSGIVASASLATFASTANAVAGANVSGTVSSATSATTATTAGTVTTGAQPNISSLGTLSALGVNGIITASAVVANTGLFTGDGGGLSNVAAANISGTVANATYAIQAGSSALALDITGAAQPNITSTGTLTSLAVTGTISGGTITGTSGVFTTVAGPLTTAAQPNVTSLGTLSSLTVSGNITNQTHIIKDVSAVSGAGTNLAGATALAGADIFSVTVPSNNNGVSLMSATQGLCIYVKNLSASNILKVYPASGDNIDSSSGAMSIGPKGQIQFVAHSSSAWYTVGATYA
jgi:hypothetical protein